jgi:hypothetical protein
MGEHPRPVAEAGSAPAASYVQPRAPLAHPQPPAARPPQSPTNGGNVPAPTRRQPQQAHDPAPGRHGRLPRLSSNKDNALSNSPERAATPLTLSNWQSAEVADPRLAVASGSMANMSTRRRGRDAQMEIQTKRPGPAGVPLTWAFFGGAGEGNRTLTVSLGNVPTGAEHRRAAALEPVGVDRCGPLVRPANGAPMARLHADVLSHDHQLPGARCCDRSDREPYET